MSVIIFLLHYKSKAQKVKVESGIYNKKKKAWILKCAFYFPCLHTLSKLIKNNVEDYKK